MRKREERMKKKERVRKEKERMKKKEGVRKERDLRKSLIKLKLYILLCVYYAGMKILFFTFTPARRSGSSSCCYYSQQHTNKCS